MRIEKKKKNTHKSFVFRAANVRVFPPLLLQCLKAEQPQVQRWVRVLPKYQNHPAELVPAQL